MERCATSGHRIVAVLALVAITGSLLVALVQPARAGAGCAAPMPCCNTGMCSRHAHDAAARWSRCHDDEAAAQPPVPLPPGVLVARSNALVPATSGEPLALAAVELSREPGAPETPPPRRVARIAVSLCST